MTGFWIADYSGPTSLTDSAHLRDHLDLCANIIFHETATEQPGNMPDGTRPIKNTTGMKQWTNHSPQRSQSKNQSSCRWLQPEAVLKLTGFSFLISDATAGSLSIVWSTWASAFLNKHKHQRSRAEGPDAVTVMKRCSSHSYPALTHPLLSQNLTEPERI